MAYEQMKVTSKHSFHGLEGSAVEIIAAEDAV
jgi:hypothetical protein